MQVGKVGTADVDGGRPPKFKSQLPQEWLTSNEEGTIDIQIDTEDFCVFCTYVVKLKSNYPPAAESNGSSNDETKLSIVIEQQIPSVLQGVDQSDIIEKSFRGKLYESRPQPLKLERGQITYLDFKGIDAVDGKVEVEVLLGDVKV